MKVKVLPFNNRHFAFGWYRMPRYHYLLFGFWAITLEVQR